MPTSKIATPSIDREVVRAQQVRKAEGKPHETDNEKSRSAIQRRWEAAAAYNTLPDQVKGRFLQNASLLVKIARDALAQLFPGQDIQKLLAQTPPLELARIAEEALVQYEAAGNGIEKIQPILEVIKLIGDRLHNHVFVYKTGLDPDVTLALENGELLERASKYIEKFFIDISGFTRLSNKLNALGQGEKSFEIAATYIDFCYKALKAKGIVYGGSGGDCVIGFGGPPFLKDGQDGLRLKEKDQNPAFHAMNLFKVFLVIQQGLEGEMKEKYYEMLYQIALLKYPGDSGLDRTTRIEKVLKNHGLPKELDITAAIHGSESTIGIVETGDKIEYTVLHNDMNLTSRMQGKAAPGELLIGEKTKQHLESLIQENTPVPYSPNGKKQTWKEFLAAELGVDFGVEDFEVAFEPRFIEVKGIRGPKIAYLVKIIRRPKVESIPSIKNIDDLLKAPGEYDARKPDRKGKSSKRSYDLRRVIHGEVREFPDIVVPPSAITSKRTLYVSEREYRERAENDTDTELLVRHEGIMLTEYESIERQLRRELNEAIEEAVGDIMSDETVTEVHDGHLPTGVYQIREIRDAADPEFTTFVLSRDEKNFLTRIPKTVFKKDRNALDGDEEFKSHFENYRSFKPLMHSEELLYVRGNGQYIQLETPTA